MGRVRLVVMGLMVTAVAGVAAVAVTTGSPDVSSKDVGFSLTSGGQVSVDFEVTKDPDESAQCAVQALSENYAVVGWKVVTIGPVGEDDTAAAGGTTAHRAQLRTDSPAVSGGVNACWIVDA